MPVFKDNAESIGRTPLVRINHLTKATVLAKIEGRNPAYSVKCRIGAAMIWDAEKRGLLGPGKELVEPTSGNTGIALAFVAAAWHSAHLDHAREHEHRAPQAAAGLRRQAGADRRRQGHERRHRQGRGDRCQRPKYVLLQQFKNPANPAIHEATTGPEIWDDTDGQVDVFVAGVGTGGTITGVTRYIKHTKGRALVGGRRADRQPGADADTRRAKPEAGAAQDPGHRRRLRAAGARSVPDRRRRAGEQR
jgi:cysteine synthase